MGLFGGRSLAGLPYKGGCLKTQSFSIGDRVKPTSGPYRRTEFEVVGVEGDRVAVQSGKLKLTFPAKLLRSVRSPKKHESPIPPVAKGTYVPCDPAALKKGDRVTFQAYWWGGMRAFEGELNNLPEPKGTAIVRYEVPAEEGEPLLTRELQSTIGFFALAKNPELESDSGGNPEADQLLAQIAALRKEGAIAPSLCWIERKVHSGGFTEAVFKSRSAIFTGKGGGLCKSKYIGKWGSPAHSEAISAVDRRNRIEKLQKQLEKIEKMLQ
jgi:hypothetical protein